MCMRARMREGSVHASEDAHMHVRDYTTYSRYYSKTGCDGMGICCKKKTVIR